MFSPVDIARIFLECMDQGAIEKFRRFLKRNDRVKKWLVAADFSLGKSRPLASVSFTILPYDVELAELERDTIANLAKELKDSKSLPPAGVSWLRDNRRFHFAITLSPKRGVFVGGDDTKLRHAQDFVQTLLAQIESNKHSLKTETVLRFRALAELAQSNGFNVRLLTDIWLLAVFFAAITLLIGRERQSEILGWFPDRDDMTNWCDGIWREFAFRNVQEFADAFEVDLRATQLVIAAPDRSGEEEVMWFDYLLRSADWFAGAVAEWDRKNGLKEDKLRSTKRCGSR